MYDTLHILYKFYIFKLFLNVHQNLEFVNKFVYYLEHVQLVVYF